MEKGGGFIMKNIINFLILMLLILLFSGCVRAISQELRTQVDYTATIPEVLEKPDAFMGKTVMWGGVIASTRNIKEGTQIEIVAKPLHFDGRPGKGDQSEGRFLSIYKGFLDTVIYAKGREVTVGGSLKGIKKQPLDEIEYTYPVVMAKEVHLWPERTEREVIYYPSWRGPYFYDYRYGPWCR